jgi:hypothetical protein
MVNDLGVDPNEWFDDVPHPHDVMPIATNDRFDMYGSSDADYAFMKSKMKRKDPPPELMEVPTSVTNPKPLKKIEIIETIHHKMYGIATAKYNPFAVGGTENITGGSEQIQ